MTSSKKKTIRKQYTITCEPTGLRIHLRSDRDRNQDLGMMPPQITLEAAMRYCNTMLNLPDDEPFSFVELPGQPRVYYSQTVERPC